MDAQRRHRQVRVVAQCQQSQVRVTHAPVAGVRARSMGLEVSRA